MAGKPNDKMFKTMVEKHGSEEAARAWFRSIGSLGGKAPSDKPKGFAANPDLARIVGRRGGKVSKRGPAKTKSDNSKSGANQ